MNADEGQATSHRIGDDNHPVPREGNRFVTHGEMGLRQKASKPSDAAYWGVGVFCAGRKQGIGNKGIGNSGCFCKA